MSDLTAEAAIRMKEILDMKPLPITRPVSWHREFKEDIRRVTLGRLKKLLAKGPDQKMPAWHYIHFEYRVYQQSIYKQRYLNMMSGYMETLEKKCSPPQSHADPTWLESMENVHVKRLAITLMSTQPGLWTALPKDDVRVKIFMRHVGREFSRNHSFVEGLRSSRNAEFFVNKLVHELLGNVQFVKQVKYRLLRCVTKIPSLAQLAACRVLDSLPHALNYFADPNFTMDPERITKYIIAEAPELFE